MVRLSQFSELLTLLRPAGRFLSFVKMTEKRISTLLNTSEPYRNSPKNSIFSGNFCDLPKLPFQNPRAAAALGRPFPLLKMVNSFHPSAVL